MNIAPDSKIYFLQNIKLDDGYINTLNWSTLADQERYFRSNTYVFVDALSYVRYTDGVIRIKGSIKTFYKCNYMMFKNSSFEDKWFYAFIKKVEYVNNSTVEITYDIDVFQTWFAVPRFNDVFVEREHVADDTVGKHTIDEGIPTGYPISFGQQMFTVGGSKNIDDLCIVLETTFQIIGDGSISSSLVWLGGVLRGAYISVFSKTEISSFTKVMQWINNRGLGDGIVAIYLFPEVLLETKEVTSGLTTTDGTVIEVSFLRITELKKYVTAAVSFSQKIEGYTPKNNKLLCYPYCFAYASNGSGKNMTLKYEFDTVGDNIFAARYFAQPGANGTLMAQLSLEGQNASFFETPIGGFPQVAYSYDKCSD